jgi:RimJ/RimL family protein N-acetyltransferase
MQFRADQVMIRTTARDDLPALTGLWNDGRVMRWVGFPEGLGYDADRIARWFEQLQSDPHRHHFCVYSPGIGFCGEVYYSVDKAHHRASLDIKFRPEAQGRGLATDALKALIRHVFETESDAHTVWTEPSAENSAAQKLYARCGLGPQTRPADLWEAETFWSLARDLWEARSRFANGT